MNVLIREAMDGEKNFILAGWKQDLVDLQPAWGKALQPPEWWSLVNHVLNTITFPSCEVWVATHRDEPMVPLAWAAMRDGVTLHCRATVRDPELAALLQRRLQCSDPTWNPFTEMKRL